MPKPLIQTTGRRKEATARVRLRPGTGKITVNGRAFEDFFGVLTHRVVAKEPLRLIKCSVLAIWNRYGYFISGLGHINSVRGSYNS